MCFPFNYVVIVYDFMAFLNNLPFSGDAALFSFLACDGIEQGMIITPFPTSRPLESRVRAGTVNACKPSGALHLTEMDDGKRRVPPDQSNLMHVSSSPDKALD